jgi:hypothetical protein
VSESDQDVSALAGLRRLVTHSRGLLRACSVEPPPESDWQYASQRWTAADIREYAALLLADQTLTLVLDCLPSPDVVSAEDAGRLRAEVHRLTAEAATLAAERDDAAACERAAHQATDEALDLLTEARELAMTDAPAAVRLLLAGDPE